MAKAKWKEEEEVVQDKVQDEAVEEVFEEVASSEGEEVAQEPEAEPEGVEEAKPPKASEAPKEEKVLISVVTSVDNVSKWDAEGQVLVFDTEPGQFLNLPHGVVKELSSENRTRYSLALGENKFLTEEAQAELPELDIQVTGAAAKASSKLNVFNKVPGMHYCWKRPDELQQAVGMGYKVTQDQNLRTLVSSPDLTRRVGAMGEDELILVEIPERQFERLDQVNKDKAAKLEGSVEAEAKREISRLGPVFDPNEVDERNYNFSAPVDERGNPLPNQA